MDNLYQVFRGKKWMKNLKWIGGVLLIAAASLFFTNEFNRTAVLNPRGEAVDGRKFGVSIGDSQQSALMKLQRRGLKESITASEDNCLGDELLAGESVETFFDYSWRNGVICIIYSSAKVSKIKWNFAIMSF